MKQNLLRSNQTGTIESESYLTDSHKFWKWTIAILIGLIVILSIAFFTFLIICGNNIQNNTMLICTGILFTLLMIILTVIANTLIKRYHELTRKEQEVFLSLYREAQTRLILASNKPVGKTN